MADNNNNNNAGDGDVGVSFDKWLEELWRPFETTEASPPPPTPRYNPSYYHPRIECRCPDGPGTKPARHWRTKCPFNPQRRVAACELCSRPFNRIDNLKRHLRVVHGTTTS